MSVDLTTRNEMNPITVLLDRSVAGARWTLLLGALSLPLTYMISVLLGRVGPDALGAYSLIILFQMACMTFLIPGADQALVRYLPRLALREKGRLLTSYGRLPAVLLAAAVVFLLIDPGPIQRLLFGGETALAARLFPLLILLAPLAVITRILTSILQSEMDIKGMAIATKVTPFLVSLGTVALVLAYRREPVRTNVPLMILSLVLAANLVSLTVAALRSYPITRTWTAWSGSIAPRGFWSFSLLSFAGAVVAFGFGNLDLVIVSNRLGVYDLGLYKAALASAEFVRWVPVVLLQTVFPFFCNLLPQGDPQQVHRAYRRLIRYTSVLVGGIGLALVCFSGDILSLFGIEFATSRGSLVLLSSVFTLSAVSTINGALVVAAGRVGRALLNGAAAVALQLVLSLWLVTHLGALGVAVGKSAHLLCVVVLDAWLAYRTLGVVVPRRVVWLMLINICLIDAAFLYAPASPWLGLGRGMVLILMYAGVVRALGLVNREDFSLVLRGALGKSATSTGMPA